MDTKTIDHSGMSLGKSTAVNDPRTLVSANYLNTDTLPSSPASYVFANNIGSAGWGMMNNDKVNDCTCAAAGHLIMEWTDDNDALVTPSDQDIINAYIAITGYDPATGANNKGAAVTDVLNYWRNTGIAGHKIFAYAALGANNHNHIMLATWLFGGCYVGMLLPRTALTQNVWSVPPGGPVGNGARGSWGGHAVAVIGYDPHGLTVITWGAIKKMTWSFWDTYCDEAFAIISTDFAEGQNAPSGFDLAALQQDLGKITA